jgi:hypothetical protein
MEVSGQLHASTALPPGREPLVPIGKEAGWAPELVWAQWRWDSNPRSSSLSPSAIPLSYSGLRTKIKFVSQILVQTRRTKFHGFQVVWWMKHEDGRTDGRTFYITYESIFFFLREAQVTTPITRLFSQLSLAPNRIHATPTPSTWLSFIQVVVVRILTPCIHVVGYQRFGGTCRLHLRGVLMSKNVHHI